MTSSLARALVLICAGWWFFGNAASCRGQQTEADAKLVETINAAAEKGNPVKQCALGSIYFSSKLGVCYADGEGVAMDAGEAVKWFRKAGDQGYAKAQHRLGFCYHDGLGVAKDYFESAKWYRKAAEHGDAVAQYNLGVYYDNGAVPAKDHAEAVKWYRKAAEQGYAPAQHNVGSCY